MSMSVDEAYMRMALAIAQDGLGRVWPNPAVGCVIVNDGVVVGMGRTADGGRPHAEVEALTAAGDKARGATVYVTLEPCNHHGKTPPCSGALIRAGVARVVLSCVDPDPRTAGQGIEALRAAGIEVVSGVCEREARAVNIGFLTRIEQNRPFVCLKQAISADGMIAAAPGERTQISGREAHEYLHLLRLTYDAIAVGIGTVLADDPQLTARVEGNEHSIVRVVFDSELRIPLNSKLVETAYEQPVWVLYKDAGEASKEALLDKGVRLLQTGACVQSALQSLAHEGLTRLLVEGGARLHHSFLQSHAFDEIQLLKSPVVLGEGSVKGADLVADGFSLTEKRVLGQDLLEIYQRSA